MHKINRKKQINMKKIATGLLFMVILLFGTYSYAVASTTFSISDIKTKNTAIVNLQTEITDLEMRYSSQLDKLSVENVLSYGLTPVQKVAYLTEHN